MGTSPLILHQKRSFVEVLRLLRSVRLSICPSVRLFVCPSVRLSVCPSVRLSACPSVRLSVCQSVRLSFCPSFCHQESGSLTIFGQKMSIPLRRKPMKFESSLLLG